jgi:hypothetical protein
LHRESAFFDQTNALTTSQRDLGVIEVPAYGYVRSIVIKVEATGGATAAVTKEDAPFTILQNISFSEPNGAVIAQFGDGYELYLANKWGGYLPGHVADPRAWGFYDESDADPNANFQFMLRIPIELNLRDALGSLPNQAANATFRLRLALAAEGTVFSTVPTTKPNIRVRCYAETWDQPEPSSGGQSNQVTPPAMNTTQFWSRQVYNVSTGAQTVRLTRVGNYIRNLIFILRDNGSRANGEADWPDETSLFLDSRPIDVVDDDLWLQQMSERTGYGLRQVVFNDEDAATTAPDNTQDFSLGIDPGVRVYDFCHEFDGLLGRENRDLWLPTLGSTRLEVQGTFGTLTSGTLTVLTNDVAIAGNVFI